MSSSWFAALAFAAAVAAIAIGTLVGAAILRVKAKVVPPTRELTYECGEEPEGDAWVRFHPRYYVVALIFVIFDVETAFMLPWALNIENAGMIAVIEMFVFLGILLLGWGYAVRKGALKWQ